MTKVLVTQLIDSPYRDRNLFPTRETTINGLVESIEQTGFWDNVLCRLRSNMTAAGMLIESPEQLADYLNSPQFDTSAETFELAYGHHRLDAVKICGIMEIDIPVKLIDNETMLRIMSNENKEGWGSSITAKLETVRQVRDQLLSQISSFDDFKDYADSGHTFFDYNGFTKAQQRGVGYRVVKDFLGKEWSLSDVRIPMSVMTCLENNMFIQEDLKRVPTLGLMEVACGAINGIHVGGSIRQSVDTPVMKDGKPVEKDGKPVTKKVMTEVAYAAPDWPLYYKRKAIAALLDLVSIPEDRVDANGAVKETFVEAKATVSRMKSIRKNLLIKGVFPGSAGSTAFDVNKEVKKEFFATLDADMEDAEARQKAWDELTGKDMASFQEGDGFKDWSGYPDLIESIATAIAKVLEEPTEDNTDTLKQDDIEDGEDYQGSDQYAEEVDSGSVANLFEDTKDQETGEAVKIPAGKAVAGMIATLQGVDIGCGKLMEYQGQIDIDKEGTFVEVMGGAVKNLCLTYATMISKEELTTLVSEVMAELG